MHVWLKELRAKISLSQQYVAERLGISRQYYQQIEAGDRQQKMDIAIVSKLSVILGVSVVEIMRQEKLLEI